MEKIKTSLPLIITIFLIGIFTLLLVAVVYFGVLTAVNSGLANLSVETKNNSTAIMQIANFINQKK